jgi:hypothetical protein
MSRVVTPAHNGWGFMSVRHFAPKNKNEKWLIA